MASRSRQSAAASSWSGMTGSAYSTGKAGFSVDAGDDDGEGTSRLSFTGAWTVNEITALSDALGPLTPPSGKPVTIDVSDVTRLDTAGAFIIDRTRDRFEEFTRVTVIGCSEEQALLIQRVDERFTACDIAPPAVNAYLAALERMGKAVTGACTEAVDILTLGGKLVTATGAIFLNPTRFRFTSFVVQLEQTGLNSLPIISLMSFLVGAVLAYMGADILAQYGATNEIVLLVGYSFLREFGVLLAAIMIAGRSGSAFTAQIGSMKQREEVDAMRTLALDPVEILILPRVLALIVAAPLVTIGADFMGLVGGALVAWSQLGISPGLFIARLYEVVTLTDFLVGLAKAPIFAMLIGMIGCYQGMMVEGSSEAVGRRTTKAVVEAIFVVIVVNATAAVLLVQWGI